MEPPAPPSLPDPTAAPAGRAVDAPTSPPPQATVPRRKPIELIPASRLRRGRPLWTVLGLVTGVVVGASAVVVAGLHQPAVRDRLAARPPVAAAPAASPAGRPAPSPPGRPSAVPSPSAASSVSPTATPLGRTTAPPPTPIVAVPTPTPVPTPTTLASDSGQITGQPPEPVCVPASCAPLTAPTGQATFTVTISCGQSSTFIVDFDPPGSSQPFAESTFTLTSGTTTGPSPPARPTGQFVVTIREAPSVCTYQMTVTG